MRQYRLEKINSLIHQTLSQCQLELPTDDIAWFTITTVNTTTDQRQTRITVNVLGDDQKKQQALDFLNAHKSKFQQALAKLNLKFTPIITFTIADDLENVARVEKMLNQIEHGKA